MKLIFLFYILVLNDLIGLGQVIDTSSTHYRYLKRILSDTSENSFLLRNHYIIDSTLQYQIGFLPNKVVYTFNRPKWDKTYNPNVWVEHSIELFLQNKPGRTSREQSLPAMAIIYTWSLPNEKVKKNLSKFVKYYFNDIVWLKEEYWKNWTQIADYLYEHNVLMKFLAPETLPLVIDREDFFRLNKMAKKKAETLWGKK